MHASGPEGPASPACPQVPRSYLSLQEAVLAEQQRRSLSDDVQYLTDRQLERLVEQTPDNDIADFEDLQSGGWPGGGGDRWVAEGPMGGSGEGCRWAPAGTSTERTQICHRSARVCRGLQMHCGY